MPFTKFSFLQLAKDFIQLFSSDVAVDLGTANTLVYVKGRGIVLDEPSVVAIEAGTGRIKEVGRGAKAMLGRTHEGIKAVRPLKDGVIEDFELTEDMLRTFIQRAIKHNFLIKPRIVVCVPSGITEVGKRAVVDSAEHAGAREVFLIAEPMAAAIGVGMPVNSPSGNMIIDIGGGTTEIVVIALSGIVVYNHVKVAGDEMDFAIIDFLRKRYNIETDYNTAELIKKTIGSAFPLKQELKMVVNGLNLKEGIPRSVEVRSEEIRIALQEPVNAIIDATKRTLEKTPPGHASDIKDRGITLAGGGALLKGLDALLHKETDLTINMADDPLTAIVLGAGKVLDDLEAYEKVLLHSKKE
ncbi:MAG: rod shape-determining protein [Candidatus Coatesbacteria bacterium]|nr:rod shape-determining protein [Candidatus Coatesbacteria bacterium]